MQTRRNLLVLVFLYVLTLFSCEQKKAPNSPVAKAEETTPDKTKSNVPVRDRVEPATNSSAKDQARPAVQSDSASNDLSHLGFLKIDYPVLPEKVRAAADSVFEIRLLSILGENSYKIINLKTDAEKIKKIKNLSEDQFDPLEKQVLLSQIERCQRENLEEACPLVFEIRKSTGFLLGSGQELWTTAHSINAFIKSREKDEEGADVDLQFKEKLPIRIFIFNSKQEMVFDGYKDKALLKILPRKTKAAEMDNELFSEDSDYLALELSKPIGPPLKKSSSPMKEGDSVFVVGYPACTGCDASEYPDVDALDFKDRSPSPNSSGKGLFVTSGKWLDFKKVSSFYSETAGESFAAKWDMTRLVVYSADSQFGHSGSPVLNQNGEVVAVHAGGKSKVVNGQLQRISRGVIPMIWTK